MKIISVSDVSWANADKTEATATVTFEAKAARAGRDQEALRIENYSISSMNIDRSLWEQIVPTLSKAVDQ